MSDPSAVQEIEAAEIDAVEAGVSAEPPLVESDLLVEDVSIDGMCGVY